MVNIASENVPIPIIALTTVEYHIDILCLEAIRTGKAIDAVWDQEVYHKTPPAEYILVASGCSPQVGHEILTFWSISYVFADEPPNADRVTENVSPPYRSGKYPGSGIPQ